jgi:Tetratricopeptide repeat
VSLIYSALSKLEQEPGVPTGTTGQAVPGPYAVPARKSGAPRWVYLVVLGCMVVVLGGWLSMSALQAKFAAMPAIAALPAVPVPVVPPIQFALAPVVAPVAVDLPVPTKADAPEMPPVIAKAMQSKPHAQPRPKAQAQVIADATPVAEEIDPVETDKMTQAVRRAIQAGKNDEAQGLLKQLATRLPPESITLLRLNAWYRMQSGDQAQAMSLYRQIGERIPGDESAGINLALLHWKAGQQEEARRLIGALAERHPESETVQRYSRELGVLR